MKISQKTITFYERLPRNLAIAALPSVIGSIFSTWKEIAADEKTNEKFRELEQSLETVQELAQGIEQANLTPVSVQVRLIDVVLFYVSTELNEKTSCEIQKALNETKSTFQMVGVDEFVVGTTCIAANLSVPLTVKEDIEEVVDYVGDFLDDYGFSIKATAYL
ncbi:hypothetical protein [Alicyclobacillus sp. SO9]|uniref:hypothetical protein n=1 Tax=Alicyclobacillus sp. SO9 TaxID=2665646 RepID=UPI0018E8BE0A|nr:hypothetical protein [Alicyclobacillus sp. SO9]QQE78369.1 hypothetical protein GI364_21240 [Alicyclobacillus sp. SO9]